MRKIIAYACSIALASSFSVAAPTAANADNGSNGLAQACEDNNNFGLVNQGACVSTINTWLKNNTPSGVCKLLLDAGDIDQLGPCVEYFAKQ
jgi:hypothetical protein